MVDDCSNYETLTLDMLPDVVDKCIRFLQSEAFFLILSNLTGLQLHHLAVVSPDTDDDDDDVTPSARGLFTLHISLSRINSIIVLIIIIIGSLINLFFYLNNCLNLIIINKQNEKEN